MSDYVSYIISFLLNADVSATSDLERLVCYTYDKQKWKGCKVVIIPSGFFDKMRYGTRGSLPELPLQIVDGVPLLYGKPDVNRIGNQIVVKADIIASTYFLISRYEEIVNGERDIHGRFTGKSSVLYKAGVLQRPLVDEYGRLLRKWLRECGVDIPHTKKGLNQIVTHDVDQIAQYQTLRGFLGGVSRGNVWPAVKSYFFGVGYDPLFTFPWMREQEKGVQSLLFMKVAGKRFKQDLPYFNPCLYEATRVLEIYPEAGIHISYEASKDTGLIKSEVDLLSEITGAEITKSRHHYLASLEPNDMMALIDAGITDDYTMGFADQVGFRLGTSRPVRWINPQTQSVTPLTLHPLIVMDRTLYDERYMNLEYDQAVRLMRNLRAQTSDFGGDFITLWHNSEVAKTNSSYARKLFYENLREL